MYDAPFLLGSWLSSSSLLVLVMFVDAPHGLACGFAHRFGEISQDHHRKRQDRVCNYHEEAGRLTDANSEAESTRRSLRLVIQKRICDIPRLLKLGERP